MCANIACLDLFKIVKMKYIPLFCYRNCELQAPNGTSFPNSNCPHFSPTDSFCTLRLNGSGVGSLWQGAIHQKEPSRIENQQAMCSYAAH